MSENKSRFANLYPYAEAYGVNRSLPEHGRPREEVLRELEQLAGKEDAFWQTGQCSGTMYCGDVEHYAFLNEAYSYYSHMNALQRDMCPSATRFEGEIVAMTLDLMHPDAARPECSPCGSVTAGGTESLHSAVLAYREQGREERGIKAPQIIKPETAHVAIDKGAHLFGVEVIEAPVDPVSTRVDLDFVKDHINENTVALVGSATNYGYGTIDDIAGLSELALEHGVGLHVDGCLGGFLLPWGEELGYDIAPFDFRVPGVTSISVDTHKYGYSLKGTSVILFRDASLRRYLYYMNPYWSGGKYFSPGIAGSRSGGLLAATWASLVSLGREGFLSYAKQIFETSFTLQEAVTSHPELRLMGQPTFCFSFTSADFDIYHIADDMRAKGWRFNGQQYPNALHMCVTRPQTQPGLAERFATDLAAAVEYAKSHADDPSKSAAIYGGIPKDAPEVEQRIHDFMVGFLDASQDVPAGDG